MATLMPMKMMPTQTRRTVKWLLLAVAVLTVVTGKAPAQPAAAYSVESVKAAFLYRFLEYVDWPVDAQGEGPLTIAVLGEESLTAELQRNVRGRTAHGREIRVLNVSSVTDGLDANVLFVSAQWKKKLTGLAGEHERDPVLVVTEGDGALERGSVINFVVVDGNVRFEVSLPAAEQRGLKLSSRLLGVALRIEKSGHRLEQTADDPYFVRQPPPRPAEPPHLRGHI
jgi:hypothetical protein